MTQYVKLEDVELIIKNISSSSQILEALRNVNSLPTLDPVEILEEMVGEQKYQSDKMLLREAISRFKSNS